MSASAGPCRGQESRTLDEKEIAVSKIFMCARDIRAMLSAGLIAWSWRCGRTWLETIVTAETIGTVAFAVVLVAACVLGAGVGGQEAVEAISSRILSAAISLKSRDAMHRSRVLPRRTVLGTVVHERELRPQRIDVIAGACVGIGGGQRRHHRDNADKQAAAAERRHGDERRERRSPRSD